MFALNITMSFPGTTVGSDLLPILATWKWVSRTFKMIFFNILDMKETLWCEINIHSDITMMNAPTEVIVNTFVRSIDKIDDYKMEWVLHIVPIEANKNDFSYEQLKRIDNKNRFLFSTSMNSMESILISFPWSRYSWKLACWKNIFQFHNDYYHKYFKYLSKNPFRGPDTVASWLFDRSGSIPDWPIQTWKAKRQVAGFYLFTQFYKTGLWF